MSDRFAKNLKLLRTQKGWTMEYVARQITVTTSFISMLEGGQRVPSMATIGALAKLFRVSPSRLLA